MSDDREAKRAHGQPEQIVRTAQEARHGEIILGKWGRRIWIGSFALMVLLILFLGFWW